MAIITRNLARMLRIACACLLVVSGAWGLALSLRAATAQALYKQAKYGVFLETRLERPPTVDANQVLRLCRRAQGLYAANYYFPILASIRSLEVALQSTNREEFLRAFGSAEHWNRVSMALNPYNIEVMHVKCRILQERGDMAGAIAFWRDVVVEREFWNPQHHDILVELYLKAGDITQAIEASRYLRGGPTLKKVQMLEARRKALRQKAKE